MKFKVFVLNNKKMKVNGSMSCHNITVFRIHPTLRVPVLRNTKSAGLKIFGIFDMQNTFTMHIYEEIILKYYGFSTVQRPIH